MEVVKLPSLEAGLISQELTEGDYWSAYQAIFRNRYRLENESCDGGGFGSIYRGRVIESGQKILTKIVEKGPRARYI